MSTFTIPPLCAPSPPILANSLWRELIDGIYPSVVDSEKVTARSSLAGFIGRMFPGYETSAHILTLVDALEWAEATPNARLIVDMPPRHSKSLHVSENLPAWYLGRNPDKRIIAASHTAALAYTFSRRVRNKIADPRYPFPGVKIAGDKGAVQAWDIEGRYGGYYSVGVGGSPTGSGADCLAAGTMVRTDIGDVDIAHLVRLQYHPNVLAFDHQTNQRVWSRIEAVREVVSDDIYEIVTRRGRSIIATGDHRFYVEGSGYRAARHLRPGDPLVNAEIQKQQDMPGLRESEGGARLALPAMRRERAGYSRHASMRLVQAGIRSTALRIREISQEGHNLSVLFVGLLGFAQRGQKRSPMRSLQLAYAGEASKQVLLSGVHRCDTNRQAASVPSLRNGVQANQSPNPALFTRLRQRCSRSTDAREWQFQFQDGNQLREMVSGNATVDHGTRRASMRRLQEGRATRDVYPKWSTNQSNQPSGASSEREHAGQFSGESCDALREMPSETAQCDAVRLVRRVRGKSIPVYDIQVARHRNFFANDVLVHNCIIIDDPIRSAADADSETTRESLWEWYQGTIRTRLEPGGSIVITATRWHDDDLTGRLLAAQATGGEQWRHIHMPAINEETGEALWPERWPVDRLRVLQTAVGPRVWTAQYQGRPTVPEGETFKTRWWRFWRPKDSTLGPVKVKLADGKYHDAPVIELPSTFDTQIQSWDMTFKTTKAGSFVVGQVWARNGAMKFLLDQKRDRFNFPQAVQAVKSVTASWPATREKLIEDKANGPAVIDTLQSEIPGIIPVSPHGSKEERAAAVTWTIEAGDVYLPHPSIAPWVWDLIVECAGFPRAKHDDQVDSLSQALLRLNGRVGTFERVTGDDADRLADLGWG